MPRDTDPTRDVFRERADEIRGRLRRALDIERASQVATDVSRTATTFAPSPSIPRNASSRENLPADGSGDEGIRLATASTHPARAGAAAGATAGSTSAARVSSAIRPAAASPEAATGMEPGVSPGPGGAASGGTREQARSGDRPAPGTAEVHGAGWRERSRLRAPGVGRRPERREQRTVTAAAPGNPESDGLAPRGSAEVGRCAEGVAVHGHLSPTRVPVGKKRPNPAQPAAARPAAVKVQRSGPSLRHPPAGPLTLRPPGFARRTPPVEDVRRAVGAKVVDRPGSRCWSGRLARCGRWRRPGPRGAAAERHPVRLHLTGLVLELAGALVIFVGSGAFQAQSSTANGPAFPWRGITSRPANRRGHPRR